MAVNPVTNKIYVANYGSADVTVIDGATNDTTTVPAGPSLRRGGEPGHEQIYVANYGRRRDGDRRRDQRHVRVKAGHLPAPWR